MAAAARYVFISSVSAYSPSVPPNYDESAPLADVDDPEATEVTEENYGGLKVACEQVSTELFGPDTTIIRPTYVIGPYDRPTGSPGGSTGWPEAAPC